MYLSETNLEFPIHGLYFWKHDQLQAMKLHFNTTLIPKITELWLIKTLPVRYISFLIGDYHTLVGIAS